MTPEELKALAGINEPSKAESDKKWADSQLKQTDVAAHLNQSISKPPSPMEKVGQKLTNSDDSGLENIADRLNASLRTPGTVPNQPNPIPQMNELDNLAARLNAKFRTSDIKIERLS